MPSSRNYMRSSGTDDHEFGFTEQRTAPLCPPDLPPTMTATHLPVPSPSGSHMCSPCAGPARLGWVLGSQCGLLGSCTGGRDRSYIRVVKSLAVVQKMTGCIGCTDREVIGWEEIDACSEDYKMITLTPPCPLNLPTNDLVVTSKIRMTLVTVIITKGFNGSRELIAQATLLISASGYKHGRHEHHRKQLVGA